MRAATSPPQEKPATISSAGDFPRQDNASKALLDEHPDAYKDVTHVLKLSADLVEVEPRLHAILN